MRKCMKVCENELWEYFITYMSVIIYSCPTHYIMRPIAVILIGTDVSNRTVNDCHFLLFLWSSNGYRNNNFFQIYFQFELFEDKQIQV